MLNLLKSRAPVFIVLCFILQLSSFNVSKAACTPPSTSSWVTFNFGGCTIQQEICSHYDWVTKYADIQYGRMIITGGCDPLILLGNAAFLSYRDEQVINNVKNLKNIVVGPCSETNSTVLAHITSIRCNKLVNNTQNQTMSVIPCNSSLTCDRIYKICYENPSYPNVISIILISSDSGGDGSDCNTQSPNMSDPNAPDYYDPNTDFETYCFGLNCL